MNLNLNAARREELRTCRKCGETKPITEYHKKSSGRGGRDSRCRSCINTAKRHRERYREDRDARLEQMRVYSRTKRKYKKEWGKVGSPQWARITLRNAVRLGKIKKPRFCSRCGAPGILHAHHDDYSKPLAVDWLCSFCHGERHRKVV
jgi:hypothetical protein